MLLASLIISYICPSVLDLGFVRSMHYTITAESHGERILTRNSAIGDKPRDAFRGQSIHQTWYRSIC